MPPLSAGQLTLLWGWGRDPAPGRSSGWTTHKANCQTNGDSASPTGTLKLSSVKRSRSEWGCFLSHCEILFSKIIGSHLKLHSYKWNSPSLPEEHRDTGTWALFTTQVRWFR